MQRTAWSLILFIAALQTPKVDAFATSLTGGLLPHATNAIAVKTNRAYASKVLQSFKSSTNLSENSAITESEEALLDEDLPPTALSARQSAQTVGYRASLLGTTFAYGVQLALPTLQDAGLSLTSGDELSSLLTTIVIVGTVAAGVLAPKAGGSKSVTLVDGKVLAASVATAIAGQPLMGLAALFVREIYYFGLAYKVEAVIGVAASIAVLMAPDLGVAKIATELALAVMIFGKFLEPLKED